MREQRARGVQASQHETSTPKTHLCRNRAPASNPRPAYDHATPNECSSGRSSSYAEALLDRQNRDAWAPPSWGLCDVFVHVTPLADSTSIISVTTAILPSGRPSLSLQKVTTTSRHQLQVFTLQPCLPRLPNLVLHHRTPHHLRRAHYIRHHASQHPRTLRSYRPRHHSLRLTTQRQKL